MTSSSCEDLKAEKWYGKGKDYWNSQPPTVDGVLGGYGDSNLADLKLSRKLFKEFKPKGAVRALDCGAGIGRVTKYVL